VLSYVRLRQQQFAQRLRALKVLYVVIFICTTSQSTQGVVRCDKLICQFMTNSRYFLSAVLQPGIICESSQLIYTTSQSTQGVVRCDYTSINVNKLANNAWQIELKIKDDTQKVTATLSQFAHCSHKHHTSSHPPECNWVTFTSILTRFALPASTVLRNTVGFFRSQMMSP
jgi:hypothetical protein